MREKEVKGHFKTLREAALANASSKDRPVILAASLILEGLILDIKRLSEAVEVLAENLPADDPPQPRAKQPLPTYWGWSTNKLGDDDIPF